MNDKRAGSVLFPEIDTRDDPTVLRNRHDAIYSDDMHMYRAKIYKVLGSKDDRLQVMPVALASIPNDERDNLPRFPPLVKGSVITGYAIDPDGDELAEDVWILSTPDFSVGYIVGKANSYGENTSSQWPYAYNFPAVLDFIFGRGVNIEPDYEQYDVIKARTGAKGEGGMIELVNNRTGDWVLFNTSGTIIAVTQEKLYLRCGTPPSPPSAGPVGFSAITMTADELNLKAPNIVIDGKQVTTGHHNMYLVGSPGMAPVPTYSGPVLIPISNTHG